MKKIFLASLIWTLSGFVQAQEAEEPQDVVVATCGDYKLIQYEKGHYFAGIQHKQNAYLLEDPAGKTHLLMLELNSEGAMLGATEALKVHRPTGEVLEERKMVIVAMWKEFFLRVTEPDSRQEKISCQRLKK